MRIYKPYTIPKSVQRAIEENHRYFGRQSAWQHFAYDLGAQHSAADDVEWLVERLWTTTGKADTRKRHMRPTPFEKRLWKARCLEGILGLERGELADGFETMLVPLVVFQQE